MDAASTLVDGDACDGDDDDVVTTRDVILAVGLGNV